MTRHRTLGSAPTLSDPGKTTKKKRIRDEKRRLAKLYKSECYICHKKFGKGFLFHHIRYVEGERTHSDFKDSDTYNEYLCPIIEGRPKGFLLLCRNHHHILEWLKRLLPDKRQRLYRAVNMK